MAAASAGPYANLQIAPDMCLKTTPLTPGPVTSQGQ